MTAERAGRPPHRRAPVAPKVGITQRVACDELRHRPASGRTLLLRLGRFVAERFPLRSHGVLTVALVLCGQAGATLASDQPNVSGWIVARASVAAGLVFLQLRALDDVLDAPADRRARPDRPLPRGLVTERELLGLALVCGLVGGAVAVTLGPSALACYCLAAAQVWLLSIRTRRRATGSGRLPASALSHSLIVPTVLALAWAASAPLAWSAQLVGTLLLAWGVGLALEVGRKIVMPDEERTGIETYSGELGRTRALALVALFLAAASAGAGLLAVTSGAPPFVALLPCGLVAASVICVGATAARLSTTAVRTLVPTDVMVLLLWPSVLAWAL